MKSIFTLLFILLGSHLAYAQEDSLNVADSLYKEDQFYIGITYNLLGNRPSGLKQSGFSTGFHFGIIKDMPLNKTRNVAIGVGLGYSLNSFNQNLLINKDSNGSIIYEILKDNSTYKKNKFSSQSIELPIEFRWRTSTQTEYKFWRIYTGFKLGYELFNVSKHKGDLGTLKFRNIDDFNKFQYGLTLTVGYNTWNLHVYYALNPVFSKNVELGAHTIDMKAIKVGLMFYVL